jgi:hypothetical protein
MGRAGFHADTDAHARTNFTADNDANHAADDTADHTGRQCRAAGRSLWVGLRWLRIPGHEPRSDDDGRLDGLDGLDGRPHASHAAGLFRPAFDRPGGRGPDGKLASVRRCRLRHGSRRHIRRRAIAAD